MKRGEIYWVRGCHPCVLLESKPDCEGRIKAIAFTHSRRGGRTIGNSNLSKNAIVKINDKGKKYDFQWQTTSMINCVFEKDTAMLLYGKSSDIVGRVNRNYLKKIERRAAKTLVRFDGNINSLDEYLKAHKKDINKIIISLR